MKITREQWMIRLASAITGTISTFGHRHDIIVKYACFTSKQLQAEFSELMRRFHCIVPGNEYFLIYETERPAAELLPDYNPDPRTLLYAVNVTGLSRMTAAAELFDLAAIQCL